MSYKTLAVASAMSLSFVHPLASAVVIDMSDVTGAFTAAAAYTSGPYTLTSGFLFYLAGDDPNLQRPQSIVNLFASTPVVLTSGNGSFNLNSIGLSNYLNRTNDWWTNVTFTFNYASGGSSQQVVSDINTYSLHNINQTNLSSVSWVSTGSNMANGQPYGFIFDDINVTDSTNAVPVPAPLPVLGAIAAFAWSRRIRARIRQASA